MTGEQLALDLGVPDPHPAFARRRREVAILAAIEYLEREAAAAYSTDRLWGYGLASVRRSCLERPVELVVLVGGAL